MKATVLLLAALLYASAGFAQERAESGPYKQVLDRLELLTMSAQPEWRYHEDIPHPEDSELDDADWPTVKTREDWKSGARVLRRWIEIPEKINGYATRGAKVSLDLYFSSDERLLITVFSNGSMVARGDDDTQQPIPLTVSAQPGQKFLIAVRLDCLPVNTQIYESQLRIEPPMSRPDPGIVRTEIRSLQPLIASFPEGKTERESAVDAAVKAIDFPALDKGDQPTFDASLRTAQARLETLKPWLRKFTINAVGNSHIDMAWLWPWTETVEVVRNTFRTALDLMREYPDFHFTMSSAQTFSWMEEKYLELFKEIKERVQDGRWEIVGGMWVEPDLNMPGGESLVRQILTGKRYFQQKFGVDVKIGWNPDSFGYSWQLPQIYKKSGMDFFVTQKIYWNDTTKFPYKLFWWEAPDGSRLLSYIPHDYANDTDPGKMATDLAAYAASMYESDPLDGREMMHLYGVGDHGGGPTRSMLDTAKRWMADDLVYPKLRFGTARGFFDDLQKSSSNLKIPTWRNEMYFEYHRGVLTTQAETKRRIRNAEELLLNAEKFSAISALFGRSYPAERFDGAWKNLLFDDFHDIFPGSGIAVNYLEAERNLENVDLAGNAILRDSLREISSRANIQGAGTPVLVFNSLSWPRKEVTEITAQLPAADRQIEVVDGTGKVVPSQLLSLDKETHRARVLVQANVPSLGYKTYYVRGSKGTAASTLAVNSPADTLENELVRVKINAKTGCIASFFDKQSNSEWDMFQVPNAEAHQRCCWEHDGQLQRQERSCAFGQSPLLGHSQPRRIVHLLLQA